MSLKTRELNLGNQQKDKYESRRDVDDNSTLSIFTQRFLLHFMRAWSKSKKTVVEFLEIESSDFKWDLKCAMSKYTPTPLNIAGLFHN